MSRTITPAQHAELKRRVAHAWRLRDEREGRDLAHEADMEALRREQLRADVGDDIDDDNELVDRRWLAAAWLRDAARKAAR